MEVALLLPSYNAADESASLTRKRKLLVTLEASEKSTTDQLEAMK
jgi:hypothetical protein